MAPLQTVPILLSRMICSRDMQQAACQRNPYPQIPLGYTFAGSTHLRQLADIGDSPTPGNKAVCNGPHEGRHGSHGQIGDEGQQRRRLHVEPQRQLKVGRQPSQQCIVAPAMVLQQVKPW